MYSSYILVSPYTIILGVNTKATAPPNAAPCRARAALLSWNIFVQTMDTKGFYQFDAITNVLDNSLCSIWIAMLWVCAIISLIIVRDQSTEIRSRANLCMMLSHPSNCLKDIPRNKKKSCWKSEMMWGGGGGVGWGT